MTEGKKLIAKLTVRSYELDSYGHVNNAIYLNYLEFARGEYLLKNGLSLSDFSEWNAFPRVITAQIDYKSPAFAENVLRIEGHLSHWKRTRATLSYRIFNETTDTLCAEAETVMAFVNSKGRPVPIPDGFKRAFAE
jgi:acyl-CoA thioester hydrolase